MIKETLRIRPVRAGRRAQADARRSSCDGYELPGRHAGRAEHLPHAPPARRVPRAGALPARALPRDGRRTPTRGSRSAAASGAASARASRLYEMKVVIPAILRARAAARPSDRAPSAIRRRAITFVPAARRARGRRGARAPRRAARAPTVAAWRSPRPSPLVAAPRADRAGKADGRRDRRHRRARLRPRAALGDRRRADRDRLARRRTRAEEAAARCSERAARPARRRQVEGLENEEAAGRREHGRARGSVPRPVREPQQPALCAAAADDPGRRDRAAGGRDRRTRDPHARRVAGVGRPAGRGDGAARASTVVSAFHTVSAAALSDPSTSSTRTC